MLPRALDPSLGQTVGNTIGAIYLGVVGAAILYGLTSLQVYWYYHRFYSRDSRLHKISVGVLSGLDTFHLFVTIHVVYYYLVAGFGDFPRLANIVWSIKLQTALNVAIILLVQSLYAYRVWLLGGYHNGILGYLVASVVAGGFAIGIVLAYETYSVDTFEGLGRISWAIDASLAASTAIDFVIASAMCYYLRKSKGPHSRMNSKISTLMQYTLSSGLFTSACSSSALIAYILLPHTFVFLGIESLLTKLYINSFLAMLNARERPPDRNPSRLSIRLPVLSQTQSPTTFAPPSGSSTDENLPNDLAWNKEVRGAYNYNIEIHAKPQEGKAAHGYPW